jgi:hypothetical protein
MTDILGNTVFSAIDKAQYGYNRKINIQDLSQGVYFIKVEFNDEINTTRIVKQ